MMRFPLVCILLFESLFLQESAKIIPEQSAKTVSPLGQRIQVSFGLNGKFEKYN